MIFGNKEFLQRTVKCEMTLWLLTQSAVHQTLAKHVYSKEKVNSLFFYNLCSII